MDPPAERSAATALSEGDRAFVAIAVGALALVAACLPAAQRLDDATDRQRPMYDDRATMEWLQYRSLTTTGRVVPLELDNGASAQVAGEEFAPSEGVTVGVRVPEPDSHCVQVSNQDGDVSDWACVDPDKPPCDPEAQLNPDL
jgi:hypothetical protein